MKQITLLVFSLLFFAKFANAGSIQSGGGTGIFCPNAWMPGASQPWVQLLDLYEGRILNGYTITESSTPYSQQIQLVAQDLQAEPNLFNEFTVALGEVQESMKFLPAGVSIYVPGDLGSGPIPLPSGCNLGAIGFYQTTGVLMVSHDAFSMLSETQKAAFLVHEALYKVQRDHLNSLGDASPTRRLVACLFANEKTPEMIRSLSVINK